MKKLVLDLTGLSITERQTLSVHVQHSLFALGFAWGRGQNGQKVKEQHADAIIISDNSGANGFMSYVPKGHMNDSLRDAYRANSIVIDAAKDGPSQFVLTAGRWMQIQKRNEREARGERNENVSPLVAMLIASMFGRDTDGVFQGHQHMGRDLTPEALKAQALKDGGTIQAAGDGVTLIVTRNGVYIDDRDYYERLNEMGRKLHEQCFSQGG